MTTQDRIKKWLERVSKNSYMEREDICFLMVQARHLIENSKRNKYPTVEFYSDWMVHTKLDRSEVSLLVLQNITKVISENWSRPDQNIVDEVSKVIGLSNLRSELVILFQENELPVELFSIYKNWEDIVGLLIYFLINKPLIFPEEEKVRSKGLKKIIREILNLEKPANFWIENLTMIAIKDVPHWCLELGGDKRTTKIIGLLTIENGSQVAH